MKYFYSIFLALFIFQGKGYTQKIHWQKAGHWKLYNIPTRTGFRVSVDSLNQYVNIELDSAKMAYFLKTATPLPNAQYAWIGAYVTSCNFSKPTIHKVLISTYAGMFFDESSKKYFQVARELRAEWLEFLNQAMMKIR